MITLDSLDSALGTKADEASGLRWLSEQTWARPCKFSGYLRIPQPEGTKYAPFFMQPHDIGTCRAGKVRDKCKQ